MWSTKLVRRGRRQRPLATWWRRRSCPRSIGCSPLVSRGDVSARHASHEVVEIGARPSGGGAVGCARQKECGAAPDGLRVDNRLARYWIDVKVA